MPPDEIPVSSEIIPRNPNCAPAFDVSHDLGDAVLWRNGYNHMDMVHHDVAFENTAFLPGGEFTEPFAEHFPQFVQYRFLPVFGDEYHVVFAFPACV